ncbi:hypothetical protein Aduo_012154 [Ancylostoma duodenale]
MQSEVLEWRRRTAGFNEHNDYVETKDSRGLARKFPLKTL